MFYNEKLEKSFFCALVQKVGTFCLSRNFYAKSGRVWKLKNHDFMILQ